MKRLHWSALAAVCGLLLTTNACDSEQQVVMADASTAATDGGGTGRSVKFDYAGTVVTVELGRVTPVTVAGAQVAKLSDLIALAVPQKPLSGLQGTDFVSADGFTPKSKSNCNALLPVSPETLAKGYLDPATRTLVWDPELGFPGCMTVRDTAEVYLADLGAAAPDAGVAGPDAGSVAPDAGTAGKTVKVTYAGNSTDVSLDQSSAVEVGGAQVDRLSDVIALAVPGKTADQLTLTGIVGADGFNPAEKASCKANFPIEGAKFAQGYIDRTTRKVVWDSALSLPGCVSVSDTAELRVADR